MTGTEKNKRQRKRGQVHLEGDEQGQQHRQEDSCSITKEEETKNQPSAPLLG